MSLPSHAIFLDADGVQTGSCFVNVGWFVQPPGMYRALNRDVCESEEFADPRWDTVSLYGYKFSREFFNDCSGHTRETVMQVIEAQMALQVKASDKPEQGYGID